MLESVLITGATGYIGAELLLRLRSDGLRCHALVRPESARRAGELFLHHPCTESAVPLVVGDLARERLGMTPAQWRCLPKVDALIHLGALARFAGYSERTMRESNVAGTLRALELARACGARAFFHFSTAYVCGEFQGEFAEHHRDEGQIFRNDYERTKLEAECALLREADDILATIIRPSVVTGDGAAGQGRGLFGVIEILGWLREALAREYAEAASFRTTLPGEPDSRINLIPLSAVVEITRRILVDPGLWGECYHLVNPRDTPVSEIKAALESLTGLSGIELSGKGCGDFTPHPRSRIEALFHRKMKPYLPYFTAKPRWTSMNLDRSLTGWRELCEREPATGVSASGDEAERADLRPFVEYYFSGYIGERAGDSAFNEVRDLDELVAVEIEDVRAEPFLVRFRSGRYELLPPGADEPVRCRFRLGADAFEDIISGETPPQQAFFSKRVRIAGDVFFGLKLGSVLEDFFRRHPADLPAAAEKGAA